MRLAFIAAVVSDTAFNSWSRGTSIATSACRPGMFTAKAVAATTDTTRRCQNSIESVRMSAAMTVFVTTSVDCATSSRFRLSTRSAITPPTGASRSIGMATHAMISPSFAASPHLSKMSQPRSRNIICIPKKKPMFPTNRKLKARLPERDLNVRRQPVSGRAAEPKPPSPPIWPPEPDGRPP